MFFSRTLNKKVERLKLESLVHAFFSIVQKSFVFFQLFCFLLLRSFGIWSSLHLCSFAPKTTNKQTKLSLAKEWKCDRPLSKKLETFFQNDLQKVKENCNIRNFIFEVNKSQLFWPKIHLYVNHGKLKFPTFLLVYCGPK